MLGGLSLHYKAELNYYSASTEVPQLLVRLTRTWEGKQKHSTSGWGEQKGQEEPVSHLWCCLMVVGHSSALCRKEKTGILNPEDTLQSYLVASLERRAFPRGWWRSYLNVKHFIHDSLFTGTTTMWRQKQESFNSTWKTEIQKILKPKSCCCNCWSSYPKADVWQTCTLSNYCANLSSNLSHTVLPLFFFFNLGSCSMKIVVRLQAGEAQGWNLMFRVIPEM